MYHLSCCWLGDKKDSRLYKKKILLQHCQRLSFGRFSGTQPKLYRLWSTGLSPFKRPFSRWIWVSRYQNVSILDFIGAKDDGGGKIETRNRASGNMNIRLMFEDRLFTSTKEVTFLPPPSFCLCAFCYEQENSVDEDFNELCWGWDVSQQQQVDSFGGYLDHDADLGIFYSAVFTTACPLRALRV